MASIAAEEVLISAQLLRECVFLLQPHRLLETTVQDIDLAQSKDRAHINLPSHHYLRRILPMSSNEAQTDGHAPPNPDPEGRDRSLVRDEVRPGTLTVVVSDAVEKLRASNEYHDNPQDDTPQDKRTEQQRLIDELRTPMRDGDKGEWDRWCFAHGWNDAW